MTSCGRSSERSSAYVHVRLRSFRLGIPHLIHFARGREFVVCVSCCGSTALGSWRNPAPASRISPVSQLGLRGSWAFSFEASVSRSFKRASGCICTIAFYVVAAGFTADEPWTRCHEWPAGPPVATWVSDVWEFFDSSFSVLLSILLFPPCQKASVLPHQTPGRHRHHQSWPPWPWSLSVALGRARDSSASPASAIWAMKRAAIPDDSRNIL